MAAVVRQVMVAVAVLAVSACQLFTEADPCSSVNGAVQPLSTPIAASGAADDVDWHAAIDSLVQRVPGDDWRDGVAYPASMTPQHLATMLESSGFNVRHVFFSFPAVSFDGQVSSFPLLKELGLKGLYIGDPSMTGALTTC